MRANRRDLLKSRLDTYSDECAIADDAGDDVLDFFDLSWDDVFARPV